MPIQRERDTKRKQRGAARKDAPQRRRVRGPGIRDEGERERSDTKMQCKGPEKRAAETAELAHDGKEGRGDRGGIDAPKSAEGAAALVRGWKEEPRPAKAVWARENTKTSGVPKEDRNQEKQKKEEPSTEAV